MNNKDGAATYPPQHIRRNITVRTFIDAGDKTITIVYDPILQTVVIDAIGYKPGRPATKDARDIALDIIGRKVRSILPSPFLPDVMAYVQKYQRAARLIESAVLSPYTTIGRRRLQKEYFTLSIEDPI
jgi:hypothetical protein